MDICVVNFHVEYLVFYQVPKFPTLYVISFQGETAESDGVFGCHLNKKKVVKETSYDGGEGRERKGPMWKLRKWTKDSGYKTVAGGVASSGTLESGDHQERSLVPLNEERAAAKVDESPAPITVEKVRWLH